ncbi:MAG: hypothetical protein HRU20_00870 [Pseudomonadales bacterium]|nr:hypothetical protein [Pseudomonadales bacterium]
MLLKKTILISLFFIHFNALSNPQKWPDDTLPISHCSDSPIPEECVINGNADGDCICKVWCAIGCGGAFCNFCPGYPAEKKIPPQREKGKV